jgi:hypothetical protein
MTGGSPRHAPSPSDTCEPPSLPCTQVRRDTHNRTLLSRDRELGGRLTTHRLQFQAPGGLEKPEFARRPLIRDTFFRRTNVAFPGNCDASGGQ